MIDPALYLAFVAATLVLLLIPGPNVALIAANSAAYGSRYGLLTVAGTSSAVAVHLGLTALGMGAALSVLAHWAEWLRWVGVLYLLYLGVRQWRASPVDRVDVRPLPKHAIYRRGFLVALTNPKTLLFYGAFFPQFVAVDAAIGAQLACLSLTFLSLAIVVDSGWAVLAGRVRGVLARRGRWRQRLSGGLLIGAGIGLALARRR
jgi:threonine/homoserine/homoserine lactone efflux protein